VKCDVIFDMVSGYKENDVIFNMVSGYMECVLIFDMVSGYKECDVIFCEYRHQDCHLLEASPYCLIVKVEIPLQRSQLSGNSRVSYLLCTSLTSSITPIQ